MARKRAHTASYYEVLGVQPTATAAEIRAAYRALAKTQHPDVSTEASREALTPKQGKHPAAATPNSIVDIKQYLSLVQ
jgi:curved DNA-binding protein CbpA